MRSPLRAMVLPGDSPQTPADRTVSISVRVTNTGKIAGDEVVQL